MNEENFRNIKEENYCCNFGRELGNKETLLYEGENFFICSAVGQMGVEGYLQICPKEHIAAYGSLPKEYDKEFEEIVENAREVLESIYGQKSVVFENGPSVRTKEQKPRIEHSHIHIIPHNGIDINKVLDEIGISQEINDFEPLRKLISEGKTYIYTEDQNRVKKVIEQSLDYSSKIMRSKIGEQIGENNTHWRDNLDLDTYYNTIKKLKGKFKTKNPILNS